MSGDDAFDDLPWSYGDEPRPATAPPRRCGHPKRDRVTDDLGQTCGRCGHRFDPAAVRRGRASRVRGGREELEVARILGGRKVGPLGLPHDVVAGRFRVQTKKLDRWPSLALVVRWLDALEPGDDVRAVTVATAPGRGHGKEKVRRLMIVDLEEYARG